MQRQAFGGCGGAGKVRVAFQEFFDEAGGVDFAVGEGFAVEIDRRYALDVFRFYLFLKETAVNHFAAYSGVQQGKLVQRLHHVRAVVAGERDVSGEGERLAHGADEGLDALIELERAAARLQDGENERAEFVAAGDTAEDNAGIRAVGEQFEADRRGERGVCLLDERETRRGGDDLREEGFQFVAPGVFTGSKNKGDIAAKGGEVLADGVQHGLVELHEGSLCRVAATKTAPAGAAVLLYAVAVRLYRI